jgi:hypothetical protein
MRKACDYKMKMVIEREDQVLKILQEIGRVMVGG